MVNQKRIETRALFSVADASYIGFDTRIAAVDIGGLEVDAPTAVIFEIGNDGA